MRRRLSVDGLVISTEQRSERERLRWRPQSLWAILLAGRARAGGDERRRAGDHPVHPGRGRGARLLGELDDAERILTSFETLAATSGRRWAIATAACCRGLLLAARGALQNASASLDAAVDAHPLDQPFELARTHLAIAQVLRRMKKKGSARDVLERARDVFAELGAPLWEARVSGELTRIGGRPPSPLELAATERQIAELVAAGKTNREVADLLFVSPNTVHANLRRIFQKLGVRSRTELAGRIDRPAP
jgi:DNA-binding CsgD family transcriptional regulator